VQIGNAEGRVNVDLPEGSKIQERGTAGSEANSLETTRGEIQKSSHVGKLNKATGLIGMTVVNQQNEKLGSIKDMVMDLDSGKVSYAVLSIGGFLGIGDKLIAIPPSAFSVSGTQNSLVLNADRARLERVPGLAENEWPSVGDPRFAVGWEADSAVGVGVSAQGEVGSDRGRPLRSDREQRSDNRLGDGDVRVQAQGQTGTGGDAAGGQVFSGRIVSIDPEKRVMRVEGESGTRQFGFTDRPKFSLGPDNRNPKLIDFKVGYNVNVGYNREGDEYVAHSVIRTDPPSTR
jgi:sporulation protein YlmC with PRC-barrel domain